MAKKGRASTMTLKDFHGGCIPSDLQLPSAPGMTVDRSSYERPGSNAWVGNPMNRGFDRGGFHRQGYTNGARGFEDRASYFPNTATIGRSYDEDERRPRSSPANNEVFKPEKQVEPRYAPENGYQPRSPERLPYSSTSYQNPVRFQSSVAPPRTPPERPSNAWTARQQPEAPTGSPWRVRNSMARLADASAIDKVSSGRWQPGFGIERSRSSESEKFYSGKDVVHAQYDDSRKVETLQISHGYEPEFESRKESFQQFDNQNAYRGPDGYRAEYGGVRGYNEGGRVVMPPEVPFAGRVYEHSDSFRREGEQQRGYDQEEKYRNAARVEERFRREEYHRGGGYDRLEVHDDGGRYYMEPQGYHHHPEVRVPGPGNRQQVYVENTYDRVEYSEVPPPYAGERTQPQRNSEVPPPYAGERTQPQRKSSFEWDRSRTPEFEHQSPDAERSGLHRGSSGERPKLKLMPRSRGDEQDAPEEFESGEPEHERPKLSLKPRSQPLDPVTGSERERQNLFGGARPRELVLKERGADDAVITGVEPSPANNSEASRGLDRQDSNKAGNRREQEAERFDSRRDFVRQDRRDHHPHHQQHQHQQQQQHPHHHSHQPQEVKRDIDRQDSWRRPVDPPPQSPLVEIPAKSPGFSGPASGAPGAPSSVPGTSSALQLAQAFSRSVNLSRSNTGSRLTDNPSPRYNINNNNNNNNTTGISSGSSSGSGFSKSNNNFVLNKQRASSKTW